MKANPIDPQSPIPLFHQIAEVIREQIANGNLSHGDALEPLREAARTWGVNLHTVRHAYTALAREGLVESHGAKGTWVTIESDDQRSRAVESPTGFVGRVVREAKLNYGMDVPALTREIARHVQQADATAPVVYVVECSTWQCAAHAREIEARFAVEARPWSLEKHDEPPAGTIVATYFHYNDIRCRWPHRLGEVNFVAIGPDPGLSERLPSRVQQVILYERDQATAETLAADLSTVFAREKYGIEPVVGEDLEDVVRDCGDDTVVMVAPRIWATLTEEFQADERVLEAEYVIDQDDLSKLGEAMGWAETPLMAPSAAPGKGTGNSE
ncbi:MAG: hypothetical protein DRQ48_08660 [Gammaproteobacteria bacterium]|nr:MAG: hypothetical protein DRQ48_08660 [Gammaproteobacteria bacterium]